MRNELRGYVGWKLETIGSVVVAPRVTLCRMLDS